MSSSLNVSTLEVPVRPAQRSARTQLRLTIAQHPNLRRVGEQITIASSEAEGRLLLSRLTPDFCSPDGRPTGPLGDLHISRSPLQLSLDRAGLSIARCGFKSALRISSSLGAPEVMSIDTTALDRGVSMTLGERVVLLLQRTPLADPSPAKYGFVGESAAIIEVRRRISEVAGLPIPVLIRGESGTGKELVARALHAASPRAARPYLSINMAALPEQVAVAELFGHARGSFTGAVQARDGYFRQASGGTIFLDEVGEASLEIQAALLRVLETGEIQALGGGSTRRVDVRVLAATDAELEPMLDEGSFRSALYHRLAAYELRVPPLRERPEDIPRLFVHFLEAELRLAQRDDLFDRVVADAADALPVSMMERLLAYPWPGNVRELNNITRRISAALCARSDVLEVVAKLRLPVAYESEAPTPTPQTVTQPADTTATVGKRSARARGETGFSDAVLIAALEDHAWSISSTSRALRISRSTLYSRIRRCKELRTAGDLPRQYIVDLRGRHGGDLSAMAAEARVSLRALQLRMQALDLLA